jgi:predicted metal-dependent hydrolase
LEQNIPPTIIRSRRRTIAFEIRKDASLVVRAPLRISGSLISQLIEKRKGWIEEKQKLVREHLLLHPLRTFAEGEEFLYLGQKYRLCIHESSAPITFENAFLVSDRHTGSMRNLLIKWYRDEAHRLIIPRVAHFVALAGLSYNRASVSNARKRWGSCSSKGNLRFNWRLVMAPAEVLDYVVVHEVAHLAHLDHSRSFWQKVESLLPGYRHRRQWLKEHGPLLDI